MGMTRSELHGLYNMRLDALNELKHGTKFGNASTLKKDDFEGIRGDVVKVRKHTSYAFNDLKEADLVTGADLGEEIIGYDNLNDFEANVSMNGSDRKNQQSTYARAYAPQPIYDAPWMIPYRQNGFAYKQTDGNFLAAQAVSRKRDEAIFTGNSNIVVNFNGANHELYGYINHPSKIAGPALSDWTDSANKDKVSDEVVDMVGALYDEGKTLEMNEAGLYVNTGVWKALMKDNSSVKGDNTAYARILAIPGIKFVKPSPHLPNVANKTAACLVQLNVDTVQYAQSMDVTSVAHTRTQAYENQYFTAMSAGCLLIKVDRKGKTGIVYSVTP